VSTNVITGVGVSPGRAVGPVLRMPDPITEPAADERLTAEADPAAESARIADAAAIVKADLDERAGAAIGDSRAVLEATALMAADPALVKAAQKRVVEGHAAPRAVWDASGEMAEMLTSLGGYMAERARDVADVRDRIIAVLQGRPAPGVPRRTEPFVLVAHDLAPADTATLDPATCLALVTAEGGPTSHTAILARALGLPAVVAAHGILDVADGTTVVVDGAKGEVDTAPSAEVVERARALASERRTFDGSGRTADGHEVSLLANVGDAGGVTAAVEANAQGVGLFRTEFCFLDRTEAPSVDEQITAYTAVFDGFPGKKVVVRTLDAGADKPLPFLTDVSEPNPALGVRGYRTAGRNPQVLAEQLEAIAAAAGASEAEVWVMAPMIATADEAAAFAASVHQHGLETAGVMVEIPAVALTADAVMAEVAFTSIGTNDLGQYTMAADRLLGDVAALNDPWQPAVLRLIQATGAAGARTGTPVGVCGEAAADPALAVVLVGLGVSSLSMTPRAIADVSAVLRTVGYDEAVTLAGLAVDAASATAARETVRTQLPVLEELGL
jgi:phosphoenolpyruvate-protein phosphotransferase (PTS system enzyme I)